jgi:hypothetical protein
MSLENVLVGALAKYSLNRFKPYLYTSCIWIISGPSSVKMVTKIGKTIFFYIQIQFICKESHEYFKTIS